MKHLVAVYGTLKRGQGNHRLIDYGIANGIAEFVTATTTVDPYLMWEGGFPMVEMGTEEKTGAVNVHVEVYRVDDEILDHLDALEGHPNFYMRMPTLLNDFDEEVEMYFTPSSYGRTELCQHGNWAEEWDHVKTA